MVEMVSLAHEISNAIQEDKLYFCHISGACKTSRLSLGKALWDLEILGLKGSDQVGRKHLGTECFWTNSGQQYEEPV